MVQGLAFLSKKSWHTKNLANQEKVWIAEQRKAAEETKTKELARQIQQEREREEFDRMAGKQTHLDRGIDWMYQGQAAGDSKPSALEQEDAAKKAEEYLLGKEFNGDQGGSAAGDFTQGGTSEGVNAVVKLEPAAPAAKMAAAASSSATAGYAEASVADRNEAFRQRVEDPMFMVSQKERQKREEVRKQQALYERVVGPVGNDNPSDEDDDGDDKKKKPKHERKRERKERRRREKESRKSKKQKRHSSSYDDSEDEEERRHERKRHRQIYDQDDDRRYSRKNYDSDRDRRNRSRRRSSRSRDDEDRKGHGIWRRRSRSRSPDDSRSRSRHYRDRDQQGRHRHSDYHHGDRSHRREEQQDYDRKRDDRDRTDHDRSSRPAKLSGYGLQGGKSSSSSNPKELGPNQDLIRQRRKTAEDERRRNKERASNRKPMSAEERAKALQEMQATAEARTKQASNTRSKSAYEDQDEVKGNAAFLQEMREQTHGIKGTTKTMSSRMAENRNTQQRLHDDSFL